MRSTLPVKVIHIHDLGPIRYPEAVSKVEWWWNRQRANIEEFPEWPVAFLSVDCDDAADPLCPQKMGKSAIATEVREKTDLAWPGGIPAGNPITKRGLELFFSNLVEDLERSCHRWRELSERFSARLAEDQSPPVGSSKGDESAFEHELAQRNYHNSRQAMELNHAALNEVRSFAEGLDLCSYPDLISEQHWLELAKKLNKIVIVGSKTTTVRPGRDPIYGKNLFKRRLTIQRPNNIEDLLKSLSLLQLDLRKLHANWSTSENVSGHKIDEYNKCTEEERAGKHKNETIEFQHCVEILEKSRTAKANTEIQLNLLVELGNSFSSMPPSSVISPEIWRDVERTISDIVVTDYEEIVLCPSVERLIDIEVTRHSLLSAAPPLKYTIWLQKFEKYRRAMALRLFAQDPGNLSVAVQEFFIPSWSVLARATNDQIGGLPHTVGTEGFFFGPMYYSDTDKLEWQREYSISDDIYPSHEFIPGFDIDNALLLKLSSCQLMDWIWGDVSCISLVIPRADLANIDFQNTVAVLG